MSRGAIYAGKAAILITVDDAVDKGLLLVRNKLRKFANGIGSVGSTMIRGGVIGSIASGFMIRQFASFSDELLNLQAKLGYFGKLNQQQTADMAALEETIRRLGRTTSFTSKEVAEAAVELAQAGFSVKEIQNSLQAVLDLARGSNYGLAQSAEILSNTIRTFNLDTRQAANVSSMFVRATRLGTIGIEDLREALKYLAGTAYNLEQSLPTVLGLLVQLSETGLKGSLGGTSPNVAMLNMIKNLEGAASSGLLPGAALKTFQNGAFDFIGTMKQMFAITKKMSAIEKTKIFQDIFNIRGARAISSLQEIEQVEKFIFQIENAGNEARQAAAVMDSGLGGSIRRATSALDDLGKTIGKVVEPAFKGLFEAVAPTAAIFDRLARLHPEIVLGLTAMPFALAAAGAGFIGFHVVVRRAADGLSALLSLWRVSAGMFATMTARQMAGGKAGLAALIGPIGKKVGKRRPYTVIDGLKRGAAAKQLSNLGTLIKGGAGVIHGLFSNRMSGAATARATAGLVNLGKGMWGLTKGMFALMNVARRFVFSFSGVFTIFEMLLLFGHKIPFIAAGFERLSRGFKGFFGELGKIGGLMSGPLRLFWSAIGILSQGNGANADIGLRGAIKSIQLMVTIVGSQLKAAWNQVVYAIAPAYDFIRKIVQSLTTIGGMGIGMLAQNIATAVTPLTDMVQWISKLFSGDGTSSWNDFFKKVAQWGAWLIGSLSGLLDKFMIGMAEVFHMLEGWVLRVERTFRMITAEEFTERMKGNDASYAEKVAAWEDRKKARQTEFERVWDRLEEIFNKSTASGAAQAYQRAITESARAFQDSMITLEEMLRLNAEAMRQQAIANLPQRGGMAGPGRMAAAGPGMLIERQKWVNAIVLAIGGSVQATRQNLLQSRISANDYLAKQLKELETANDTLENIEGKMNDGAAFG